MSTPEYEYSVDQCDVPSVRRMALSEVISTGMLGVHAGIAGDVRHEKYLRLTPTHTRVAQPHR